MLTATVNKAPRMVQVMVRMLGTLRDASVDSEDLIFQDEVDVSGTVQRLVEEHGERLAGLLLDNVLLNPFPNALILLNGVEINNLEGLRTAVRDGDLLTIIPIVHGG